MSFSTVLVVVAGLAAVAFVFKGAALLRLIPVLLVIGGAAWLYVSHGGDLVAAFTDIHAAARHFIDWLYPQIRQAAHVLSNSA